MRIYKKYLFFIRPGFKKCMPLAIRKLRGQKQFKVHFITVLRYNVLHIRRHTDLTNICFSGLIQFPKALLSFSLTLQSFFLQSAMQHEKYHYQSSLLTLLSEHLLSVYIRYHDWREKYKAQKTRSLPWRPLSRGRTRKINKTMVSAILMGTHREDS